jgi:hypothetical protein
MQPKTVEFIILSGWSLLIAVCLIVVCVPIAMWALGQPVHDELAKMALMAMSFLFGSLPTMVKDLIGKPS